MNTRRWFCPCLVAIAVLLLAAPLFGEARRGRRAAPPPPTPDVEATVVSLRRLQLGTYVEVMRDDGLHEWIDIKSEEGMEVVPGQRVAYSTRSRAHESSSFGMLRSGADFRILDPQRDDRIYRGTGADGALVFTDNPSAGVKLETSVQDAPKQKKGKKQQGKKVAKKPDDDEVVVVSQEERRRREAAMEELYRYSEQASIMPPERKAKRAKPRQN